MMRIGGGVGACVYVCTHGEAIAALVESGSRRLLRQRGQGDL